MKTLTTSPTYRHTTLRVATARPMEFIDITDEVQALVADACLRAGFVNIQSLHTTTGIVINEHEPLLLTDFAALLEKAAPEQGAYRHDDAGARTVNLAPGERPNGHAHCRALLLAPVASLNIADGRLQLGTWQRIFLAELDGPRSREISVLLAGETGR